MLLLTRRLVSTRLRPSGAIQLGASNRDHCIITVLNSLAERLGKKEFPASHLTKAGLCIRPLPHT